MTADARRQRAALPCAVQALERYEASLLCLADREAPGIRFALWRDLQEVRRALLALPGLQAAWSLLLISHHELIALADSSASVVPAGALQVHLVRIQVVVRLCREMQPGADAPAPASSGTARAAAFRSSPPRTGWHARAAPPPSARGPGARRAW